MDKIYRINFDAISKGVHTYLELAVRVSQTRESLEGLLHAPPPPKKVHAVLWQGDWWRGVELAALCVQQAFAVEPVADRATVLRLAFNRREGRKGKPQTGPDAEVLSVLEHLLANVEKTGDPEFSKYPGQQLGEDDPELDRLGVFAATYAADIEEASSMWEEASSSKTPEVEVTPAS